MKVNGIDHVGIVVPSLDAASDWLRDKFLLTSEPELINAEQGVCLRFIWVGETRLEILEPSNPEGPLRRFLQRHPRGGLHHISLAVESLHEAISHLTEHGVDLAGQLGLTAEGREMCFLRPSAPLGVLFELEHHDDWHGGRS